MKVHLLYRDRDADIEAGEPPRAPALVQDLELETIFTAMAGDDRLVHDVCRNAVLEGLHDPEAIRYRQAVLVDCLNQRLLARRMYELAGEALESERKVWGGFFRDYPEGLLTRSVDILRLLMASLRSLRALADEWLPRSRSDGLRTMLSMLQSELDDEYLATVDLELRRLKLETGVLMSAELGQGNKGTNHVLRRPRARKRRLREMVLGDQRGYTYQLADRDEAGARALAELRNRGLALVATAVGQSADHVLGFFRALRTELAFYVGCLNLQERLSERSLATCFPDPRPVAEAALSASGLYDMSLGLTLSTPLVTNGIRADGRELVVITGANRGGKSTFLRGLGLGFLLMQAGMFVPATEFTGSVSDALFTHYKREEDATMQGGKLDEELARMSSIVDMVTPGSVVLLNESLASTNEREGSEIGWQIVRAMLEAGVRVCYVTHLYDLAHRLHRAYDDKALFLRAEREPDGRRTFRLVEGAPLPTSYGGDLYRRIFAGAAVVPPDAEPPAHPLP